MSDVIQQERPITAQELWALGLERAELVDGWIVEGEVPGEAHGGLQALIIAALVGWARRTSAGRVLAEVGFYISREPKVVRIPDVSYVSSARCQPRVPGFSEVVPDLAVEVVSPNDHAEAVQRKVTWYLDCGVREVWVVHPQTRTLVAWRPDAVQRFRGDAVVTSDVLPGFESALPALLDY